MICFDIVTEMTRGGWSAVLTVPYYCAMNSLEIGITDCMKTFENIDITKLAEQTMKYARTGMIDPTHNLLYDRVYVFDGLNDTTVMPGQNRPSPCSETTWGEIFTEKSEEIS